MASKRGDLFDLSEIILQVAIVLCTVAILTSQNLFTKMGVTAALVGLAVAAAAFFF